MGTSFQVGLEFSAKTQQLDAVVSKIQKFERDLAKLKGADPFQPIENSARGAGQAVDGMGKKAKVATGAVNGLGSALRGLAIGAAALQAGKFIFGKTAELESQTASLKVLTGELGKAKSIISELQQFANVTPFTSTELVETAKRLKAFGVDTEKLVDTTKRLGDVAGATGADLSGIATAYGQIQAKGRLQGEELLQLQERGINLQDELQKMYKMSGDEFRSSLEKGKFSAEAVEVALKNLTSAGGKYANGAISQSETLNGKLSTLQDAFDELARKIGKALSPAMIGLLTTAAAETSKWSAVVGDLGDAWFYASEQIKPFINGLGQVKWYFENLTPPGWAMKLTGGLGGALPGAVGGMAERGRELKGYGGTSRFAGARDAAFERARGITGATAPAAGPPPALLGGTGKGKPGGGAKPTATEKKMLTLTGLALEQGFSPANARIMAAIALAESGGDVMAHNNNRATGDNSYGLWQINMIDRLGPERRRQFGLQSNEQLFNPQTNARAAKGVFESQGFGAWSVFKSGAYKQYLGQDATVSGGGIEDIAQAQLQAQRTIEEQLATSKQLAAAAQLDLQIAQARDPLQRAELEGLKAQQEIKQKFAELQGEALSAEELLNLQLAEKNELAIAGLETEERINQVLQDRADMMRDLIGKASEPTAFDPTTKTQTKIAEMGAELADTEAMFISLAGTIEGQIGSAMSNAISGVIQGTTTVKQAFSQMFISIGESFVQMATQMIAKALVMKVLGILGGAFGGGGNGGVGGWNFSSGVDFGASADLSSGFSFSGGGYTGNAPRSGGIDGEGGFPAILHPQETVVDHSRLRSGMSGGRGGGASPITLNVTATRIGDSEFVKVGDLQAAMRQTRKEAAADGEKRTLAKLQQSVSTRRRVGI